MKYVVENFAAANCTVAGAPRDHSTLKAAREDVRRRLKVKALRAGRRVALAGALEAYRVDGGGGVAIFKVLARRAMVELREEARLERTERRLAESHSPPSRQRAAIRSARRAAQSEKEQSDRETVLAALELARAREPGSALQSVREVRELAKLPKERFDAAALELFRANRISLHHHDYPAGLTKRERDELVQDARGTHYIGIAPRSS